MTPVVAGGQMGYFANGAEYLEGGTELRSPAGALIGVGFAEATNYAKTVTLQAELAGLPAGDRTMNLLARPEPSAWERIGATVYLLWPPNARELKGVLACCHENGL